MRVITGTARGRILATLSGEDVVRPTAQRVKEALFSAIQFDIEGRRILDLFAGSGQLGIEALSRGAKGAVFVDASKDAVEVVKSNLKATGLLGKAEIFNRDYRSFLISASEIFDIAFLDPPYNKGLLADALALTSSVMSDYGIIICEHPPQVILPKTQGDFSQSRTYRYGKTAITLYRKGVE